MANFVLSNNTNLAIDDKALAEIARDDLVLYPRIIISQDPAPGTPLPTGSTVKVKLKALAAIGIDKAIDVKLVPPALIGSNLEWVATIRETYPNLFVVGGPSEQDVAAFIKDYNVKARAAGKPVIADSAEALAVVNTVAKLAP